MKKGLILIDIQNDYFPGGKYVLNAPKKAAEQAVKILSYFREKGLPVFHVSHVNVNLNPAFFAPHSEGVEFFKDVAPLEGEIKVIKHSPDSFFKTDLKEQLDAQGVTHLVICGMMTHMCIDTTVRSASHYGYPIELIEDACATRDLLWEEHVIPAKTVQSVFMAALASGFASVDKADEWLSQQE